MKCSVDNCLNETRTTKKSHGITFHLFPKEPLLRGAWMDALGLTGCESREPSVVCSDHFRGEDFFERGGLRMIKKGALPLRAMESEVDLDVPASLRVCRICLATDSTMYDIKESNLDQQYQQITGIFSSLEDRLPQRLCWECGHRLKSAISFKNKAVRAHDILVQMLSSTSYITLRDIKTINRFEHNLKSTLVERSLQKHNINPNTIKIIKCESYNDNDNEYNDKEYNNKDCKDSENNDNECIIDTEKKNDADNEYNDYEYIDNGYNDNEVEKLENIIKVEIKHEPRDDMFYEECNVDDDTESESEDDNKKLSEIYPHIMEREKASVKKRKIVEKKVRVVKKKEDGDGVKKKKDGISMLDKLKMDSDDDICTPPDILELATKVTHNLLPEKSRKLYEKEYNNFLAWKIEKKTTSFSENVILAYLEDLSDKFKPSSMWAKYSMLKSTLSIYNNIDITKYSKVIAFLKRSSEGHKEKKSLTFTSGQIKMFLEDSPDIFYLFEKVALIFGIMGACRRQELYNIQFDEVSNIDDSTLMVKVSKTKTKIDRSFVVTGNCYAVCKKYMELRPTPCRNPAFFLSYRSGKCVDQRTGINKFGALGKTIASFLNLPNPALYTGHCFRRTSATLLDSGGDLIAETTRGVEVFYCG